MRYVVYFLEGVLIKKEVEASYFKTKTVASNVTSTTVVFYNAYDKPLCMFTNVIKVSNNEGDNR